MREETRDETPRSRRRVWTRSGPSRTGPPRPLPGPSRTSVHPVEKSATGTGEGRRTVGRLRHRGSPRSRYPTTGQESPDPGPGGPRGTSVVVPEGVVGVKDKVPRVETHRCKITTVGDGAQGCRVPDPRRRTSVTQEPRTPRRKTRATGVMDVGGTLRDEYGVRTEETNSKGGVILPPGRSGPTDATRHDGRDDGPCRTPAGVGVGHTTCLTHLSGRSVHTHRL